MAWKYSTISWLVYKRRLGLFCKSISDERFQRPLNRYRAQNIDWEELPELDKKLKQPAFFITGTLDPVNFFIRSEEPLIDRINTNYENLIFAEELEGIGHWTQQEAPEEVNKLILRFLKQVS